MKSDLLHKFHWIRHCPIHTLTRPSAKHFFSDPTHLVQTALNSLTLTNPSLAYDPENKIIFRRPDTTKSKVAIVSGGGSGHEPAFAGYVGKGFLDASAAGTIFASPSAEQIRKAVMDCVDNEKGVLIIPMNYTGDVLNFGMATEKARAAGIKTEFFAINDDVGVGKKKGGKVGRRGISGGILVLKIVSALAEAGGSLEDVYRTAQLANKNLVSVGSSLEHVHVPGRAPPTETIPDGEVEVGMGIHNEPGSHREKFELTELVATMLLQLLDHNDPDRAWITRKPDDEFVLLINNLGGVSALELSGITDEVYRQLNRDYNVRPIRVIQGTFLTSLNGLGFSISLMKLVDTGLGEGKSFLELLDAPAEAVGWSAPIRPETWEHRSDAPVELKRTKLPEDQPSNVKLDVDSLKKVLGSALKRVIAAEPEVTRFDTIVGDGDCGVGLKRGAEAVLKLIEDPSSPLTDDVVNAVNRIVSIVENVMDGTSGAIYAIFLNALAHGLREQDRGTTTPATVDVWAAALSYSLTALSRYTPAQPGDRTLLDALVPFCTQLQKAKDVHVAAKAAQEGTDSTKNMKASLGRSVYVGGEDEWVGKIPDPGAYGLSVFLNGLSEAL
ncbi:putative dihydroxyacetone kinase (DakA) [Aspergillus vadensis CBS 113365]|uniref:Dihydroxyacetone kinase n=2 Tax=Aspergillus subgen. Circumdati TaxID=2720871 RepID=A0A319CYG5_ASPVC|nr:dihydroxyacetone kinase [Aspergillus costaricaensis CBS 115574]XP_025566896.1 dihydroxyacetone kinase [Aspergillus vadensis CBS 113365]PYH73102.1 dihydroxyacetone kinase [Aspergillus vadensis CBS 113365]RAK84248.1 dihydroxyacetone kinase [Aspergillus costaricaensis CBS 115574]